HRTKTNLRRRNHINKKRVFLSAEGLQDEDTTLLMKLMLDSLIENAEASIKYWANIFFGVIYVHYTKTILATFSHDASPMANDSSIMGIFFFNKLMMTIKFSLYDYSRILCKIFLKYVLLDRIIYIYIINVRSAYHNAQMETDRRELSIHIFLVKFRSDLEK
ncbi:hypothetical protein ACJX0J_023827, partial [Zea mays]